MPQSAVGEGEQHRRTSRKRALGGFVIASLLVGAASWVLRPPHTAVVVSIDEIEVDAQGFVTVTWSPAARRDAKISQGCTDVANPDVPMPEPLQQSVHGLGLLERWRSTVRDTMSVSFLSTNPQAVELLVEKGRRYFLCHGDTLPLVRADREYEGHVVRHEIYVAVTPP